MLFTLSVSFKHGLYIICKLLDGYDADSLPSYLTVVSLYAENLEVSFPTFRDELK